MFPRALKFEIGPHKGSHVTSTTAEGFPPPSSDHTCMTTSLSEKAKGKQRAVGPSEVEQGSSSTDPVSRNLTIRFTEGGSDLIVHVGERDTVKDVKQKVFDMSNAFE